MHSQQPQEGDAQAVSRRAILEAIGGASGAGALRLLLPAAWVAPTILLTSLPAHAACSGEEIQVRSATTGRCETRRKAKSTTAGTSCPTTSDPTCPARTATLVVTVPPTLRTDPSEFEVLHGEFVVARVAPSKGGATQVEVTVRLPDNTEKYALRWVDKAGALQTLEGPEHVREKR